MSQVEKLLKEHCPNGVPFRRLGSFATMNSSGVDKKIVAGQQSVSLLNYLDVYRNANIAKSTLSMQVSAKDSQVASCNILNGDIFITPTSETRDDIGHAAVATEDMGDAVFSYHVARLRLKDLAEINPHFIRHLFRSGGIQAQILGAVTGMTRFGLTKGKWEDLVFPIPPRLVQDEIVRILDELKDLESAQATTLERELEARAKQFYYYRKALMTFPEQGGEAQWALMRDVVTNLDSKRKPVTRSARITGPHPYFGANGVQDYVSDYIFDETLLLVGEDGSVVKPDGTPYVNWSEGKAWVNNHAHVLTVRGDSTNLRFLFHWLQTVQISEYVTGSSQRKLNQGNLNRILVPLPPRDLQDRLCAQLDVFHSSVQQLKSSLSAEIVARRRQYEHYRDSLLTFKEIAA